ncbi:phage tail tape measure protein, partial [Schleiferilactobacillus shenzhenensis]
MDVVTSTMTQFGIKAGDTTKVTDAMTYAANATKSGFADLGEAMQYTGASANAAGIPLNDTIAMLGLMSNAGLQGSMAGTAFNAMLQKLAAASTDAKKPMGQLGVNVAAFKKGQIGLPDVIEQVAKGTSKMSDATKVAAINAAFGERGGRAVLALMKAGKPAIEELTKATADSAGATKKVSDIMGQTAKANFDRLKQSAQVLAITVGEKLLPAITPLIGKATDMVNAFGKMDSATQQSIIKWVAFAAVIGPVSSGLGSVFKLLGGAGSVIGTVTGGLARATSAAKLGGSAMDVLKSAFSKTAFEALKVAPSITAVGSAATGTVGGIGEAAGASTGLVAALGGLGPAAVAAGLAIGAGAAVWTLWGKKAWESAQETSRWGTSVGGDADRALSKYQGFSRDANTALQDFTKTAQSSAKAATDAFGGMASSISQSAKDTNKALNDMVSSLPTEVAKTVTDGVNKQKAANKAAAAEAAQTSKNINAIYRNASKEHRDLTADEQMYILNSQTRMNELEVQTLNLSSAKKKTILATLNGDVRKMSKDQQDMAMLDLQEAADKQNQIYIAQQNKLKEALSKGTINTATYDKAMDELSRNHGRMTEQIIANAYKIMKSQGETADDMDKTLRQMGSSY